MLNKLDDYPIHQTPEPVAHTLGGDRNAYDRYWFNGFTREADLFFAVALGVYPNRRVMDAAVSVVRGGLQYVGARLATGAGRAHRHARRTDLGRGARADARAARPDRAESARPRGRAGLPRAHRGARRAALHAAPWSAGGMDSTRFTQFGTWEGWLEVGAERIKLDASHVLGTRDRSWGVRPVGERETTGAPARRAAVLLALGAAPLRRPLRALPDQRGRGRSRAELARQRSCRCSRSGQPIEEMASVRHSVKWEKGTRRARAAELELVPRARRARAARARAAVTFQMRGIGYTDPDWGHGMWKGEDVTSGALWRLAEIDPMEPWHLHVQQLCRVRAGRARRATACWSSS